MKTALITGVTGQDGVYLAEFLLSKNYSVVGTSRDVQRAASSMPRNVCSDVQLVAWDAMSGDGMLQILQEHRPCEIYNLAAYSSGSGMCDDPVKVSMVNGLGIVHILEAVKSVDPAIRVCQASSREVFGDTPKSPQTELTVPSPRNPYGVAKLYADNMVRFYRSQYGFFCSSAILYNHESPRRGLGFVTRKITHAAAEIKLGISAELFLGNLDVERDWGYAGDFVKGMWLMLQHDSPDDFVFATGQTHSVRQFCKLAFGNLGLNYLDFVKVDESVFRVGESTRLVGCPDKARKKLGWETSLSFEGLVSAMVESDFEQLSNSNYNLKD